MRKPDTTEEAKIRAEIEAKGIKNLSPKMVIRVPKNELEPLVIEGMRDYEICKCFQVSHGTINFLRRFYELPGVDEVRKMLACVEPEPSVEEALIGADIEDVPTYTAMDIEPEEKRKITVSEVAKAFNVPEHMLRELRPPLFFWKGEEPGRIAYGIVAGIARMLREMDGEVVEVSVVVRRA